MDILIKNIGGLPEDGDLTLTITPKGQVILGNCIFTSNFGREVKAVALPEHHGRLIDADAFIEKNKEGFETPWEEHGARIGSITVPLRPVEEAINNAPVIVEANNE